MRVDFAEYYTPDDGEYLRFVTKGVVAFDANVLLAPYRIDPRSREDMFRILDLLKENIWVPRQAAWEFFENRLSVIAGQESVYNNLLAPLKKARVQLEEQFAKLVDHPIVDHSERQSLLHALDGIMERIRTLSSIRESGLEEALRNDPVLNRWETLLGGRVGDRLPKDRYAELCRVALDRIDNSIPPGYLDADKADNPEGDAILWLQLLDRAKEVKKPVLLVTNDAKSDWYRRYAGHTVGPRVELVREMQEVANADYYQQKLTGFLKRASRVLQQDVKPETVQQVEVTSHGEAARSYEQMILRELSNAVGSTHQIIVYGRDGAPNSYLEGMEQGPYPDAAVVIPNGIVAVEIFSHSRSLGPNRIARLERLLARDFVKALIVITTARPTSRGEEMLRHFREVLGKQVTTIVWPDRGIGPVNAEGSALAALLRDIIRKCEYS